MVVPARAAADKSARPQPADARNAREAAADRTGLRARAFRVALVFGTIGFGFLGVGAQLVQLGLQHQAQVPKTSIARPLSETYSRPDIVDRNGHILATDVVMQSIYADPSELLSANETLEALERIIPGISTPSLQRKLANRKRRFAWIKRGVSPATAQKVHELGLPGIEFKPEPKRSYPQGRVAGHLIGHVNVDNKGTAAIERYVDASIGVRQVVGEPRNDKRQLRLSIDLRAQVALESELAAAMQRYQTAAASGVVLDVHSGAVRAAASLPSADPANPVQSQHLRYLDRLKRGTYELGSIFKAVTIAMALERRTVTTETMFDVRNPIEIGKRFRIADDHGPRRPISVEDIFIYSSNVGAGLIALEVGEQYQRQFLGKLGLLDRMQTEAGFTAEPQRPPSWGKAEVVTIAYGHGLAVAPLQFAAAGATLVNGGFAVKPVFVERAAEGPRVRLLSGKTSAAIRKLMRRNVTSDHGSGRLAAVAGYDVGGKTGTADRASVGGYDGNAVVTSFFAAFPMAKPRFVVLVTLHDPKASGAKKRRYAGLNAAPTTGRIIARIAPLLGVLPQ